MRYNMNPEIKFHNLNIDNPMSSQLLDRNFEATELGKLRILSNGGIGIEPIPHPYRTAQYIWRVVNITVSSEDAVMTRFRAFDLEGRLRPEASFGVWFGSYEGAIKDYFKYEPTHGTQYYVPQDNRFMTVEQSGYEAQVLDRNYPSEALKFGLVKTGHKHDGLIVDFRLFALDEASYP
jgi:hypothetical protein